MKTWFFENYQALWLALPFLVLLIGEVWLRKRPIYLVLVRLIWMTSLVFLIMDLNFFQSTEYKQQGKIYLVLDDSDSVSKIPERRERLLQFRSEVESWSKESNQNVEVFSISDTLSLSNWDQSPRGGYRSLLSSLDSLPAAEEGAVIFVSDGNLLGNSKLKLPVLSVQLGKSDERDVWFQNVKPVFTAFLKNKIRIPIEIGHKGFKGSEVQVQLWRAQDKVFEQTIELDDAGAMLEVPYFPERMGEDLLRAEIKALDGELSDLNNSISFRIRTVRDKIRILHISGRPDIDLKAWRIFLTRQPDVDIVSFYILRSLQDEPNARNSELSLIPFPYQELFSTELDKFDIVLLQNFNFNLYFQSFYLRNLAEFVLKGGALMVFGGDQSLHEYKDSPLDPLFPFRYLGDGELLESDQKAKVISRHPIVKGLEPAFESRAWKTHHRLLSEPGAEDLVRFANGTPFLSIREIADGRVAAWNSDESWRIHFEPSADSAAFGKVARRLLQYLTFDPEMDANRIVSEPWHAGKPVQLSLVQKNEAMWKISKTKPNILDYSSKKAESKISYDVKEPGVYVVEVSEFEGVNVFETEEKPWLNEWKELVARSDKLERLSERTNGKYFSFEDRKKVFDQNVSGRQLIAANVNPWSREDGFVSWFYLLVTLSFLFVDFYLRKKFQWDA